MKLAIYIAFKNLLGAGLRTWINVLVLSFSFVAIIWIKGIMLGWDHQAKSQLIEWEIGHGQYWHTNYDPNDSFTWDDSHASPSDTLINAIREGRYAAIFVAQGVIYPEGRMVPVCLKGINTTQQVLKLPTSFLIREENIQSSAIPVMMGAYMANACQLKEGDQFLVRWRDMDGVFDAREMELVKVFATPVPTVDAGQIWLDCSRLQNMMGLNNEITLLSIPSYESNELLFSNEFQFKSIEFLLSDIEKMVQMKSKGQSVFYLVLLVLAMLAIFDTQVLSVFKRRREIGTYIALGYTRSEVVRLFTIEGGVYALLASALALVYGYPFLLWQYRNGFKMPVDVAEFGIAGSNHIYPLFSLALILGTFLLIAFTTLLVSYLPARKIAALNPAETLKGRLS